MYCGITGATEGNTSLHKSRVSALLVAAALLRYHVECLGASEGAHNPWCGKCSLEPSA